MSEKTLKFTNIKVSKKEFHKSKKAINLNSAAANKIVVSDKCRHSEEGLSILFVIKKMKLSDHYVLYSLK